MGRWRGALGRSGERAVAVAAVLVVVSGCGLVGGPKNVPDNVPDNITVTSQVFSQGVMAPRYTCHGAGQSPAVHWSGAPPGTKSIALVMDDSAAPITPYIYWIVFDIGSQTTGIQAGQLPTGARQADNSTGTARYDPPCPLNGSHAYRFTVYALGQMLKLPNRVGLKTAWTAIARAAIARGRLTATARP